MSAELNACMNLLFYFVQRSFDTTKATERDSIYSIPGLTTCFICMVSIGLRRYGALLLKHPISRAVTAYHPEPIQVCNLSITVVPQEPCALSEVFVAMQQLLWWLPYSYPMWSLSLDWQDPLPRSSLPTSCRQPSS